MNRTAWAVRHVDFEDLGILHPLLYARGYSIRYLDVRAGELEKLDLCEPDLLVVLGGPMGATDFEEHPFLRAEVDALRQRRMRGLPSLGICLGAQLMAVSAGGTVRAMPRKEIGGGPVRLTRAGATSWLAPLAAGGTVLHWHGDEILPPAEASVLANTPACPVQAFALPGRSLGLQFHLEANLDRIGEWTEGHAAELAAAGLDPAIIEASVSGQEAAVRELAGRVFGAWLDGLRPHPGHAAPSGQSAMV